MRKLEKTALLVLLAGILSCGFALFYAHKFAMTGSQATFVTFYITGVALTAFASARLAYLLVLRMCRLKRPASLLALLALVAVLIGLFLPFYLIS